MLSRAGGSIHLLRNAQPPKARVSKWQAGPPYARLDPDKRSGLSDGELGWPYPCRRSQTAVTGHPTCFLASGVKYWEEIADQLSKAGWTWGHVRFVRDGRYIDVVDARCSAGKRHIVWADDKLTAFLELQRALNGAQEEKDRRK
jgi:hypothetical protein